MRSIFLLAALACVLPHALSAQIRVNPTGVNVNTQGATTVFLTFGGVANHTPVEALWCGRLIPASPARGMRCDPTTIFGRLPLRSDLSRMNAGNFTDIMSIPPSVARRAYQDAQTGETSSFYYVRRFASRNGGPDEYVAVTCRLAGGGARVPLALTRVDLRFAVETPVLFIQPGQHVPAISAQIDYNGTGRLAGRWEVVLPGDEPPTARDLLTEGTLPLDERALQRHFTQLERFNIFLPPTGRVTLVGPDPSKLPNAIEGTYTLLLRIEASDDKEGDSNLSAAGAGQGIAHSGAVAGFAMPTLRYIVGAASSDLAEIRSTESLPLISPAEDAVLSSDSVMQLHWSEQGDAAYYRVEVENAAGSELWSALIAGGSGATYVLPQFLRDNAGNGKLRWRVLVLDHAGRELRRSSWRRLVLR